MSKQNNTPAYTAVVTGALSGIGNAVATYTGAVAAAQSTGLAGAAATTSALATLGGGSLAVGGGGMAGGVIALAIDTRYTHHYTDASFWDKLNHWVGKISSEIIEKALWLNYLAQDPEVPTQARVIIYSALGYFIMPIDLIPDAIPVIGFSDDLSVLLAAVAQVAHYMTPEIKLKTEQRIRLWFSPANDRKLPI